MRRVLRLRDRLILLVLLAVLPAFGLVLYMGVEQRRTVAEGVRSEARRLADLTAAGHERLLAGSRDLLLALSALVPVRLAASPSCGPTLAALLDRYPQYANFGVAAPDGTVVCSAVPLRTVVSIADRAYFRRAIETRSFAVGEYQVGRATGIPSINFGLPVVEGGRVVAVVFAAFDLAALQDPSTHAGLPPGSVVWVMDRRGTILSRYPDPGRWVGRNVSRTPVGRAVLTEGEGTESIEGLDGARRLYAFSSLQAAGGDIHVAVGIPEGVAFAGLNAALLRTLAGLAAVLVLAVAAAWAVGDRFLLRRLRVLAHAADRMAAGDPGARTSLNASGDDELDRLIRTFDGMAEAVQAREAESRAAAEALRRSEHELRARLHELRRSNEERQRLLAHLAGAQERERARIASDIHDDTIQAMTAVGIRLERLRRHLQGPDHRALLDQLQETVAESIRRLRHLLFQLRPPSLDREGLASALRLYLRQICEGTGCAQELTNRLTEEPPEETRLILYRIAQEALNNVRKHAGATRVEVLLESRDSGYYVRVRDDGKGFPLRQVQDSVPGHLGFLAMRERAEVAGGWWRATSGPGRGTTVEFWLPAARTRVPSAS